MGDLFFIIRMAIYSFLFVILMQIKIGPTTLEQKVVEFTHHSEAAGYVQQVAQGAVSFIGVQYNWLMGSIKQPVMNRFSESQRPGSRLKSKINEVKESVRSVWRASEEKMESAKDSMNTSRPEAADPNP